MALSIAISVKDTITLYLWIVLYPHIHLFIPSYFTTKGTRFAGAFCRENMCFVRPGVIETPTNPWQGLIIPLNHGRFIFLILLKPALSSAAVFSSEEYCRL